MTEGIRNNEPIEVAKAKFFTDFEEWLDANPKYEEVAELLAAHPQLYGKEDIQGVAEGIFLFFIYGMELMHRRSNAASKVALPTVQYNPNNDLASHKTHGPNTIGWYFPKELTQYQIKAQHRDASRLWRIARLLINSELGKTPCYRGIPENLISELVISGAHEYAHTVFEESVSMTVMSQAMKRYRIHDKYYRYVESDFTVDPGEGIELLPYFSRDELWSIYDSTAVELMAINWEAKVLKTFLVWEAEKIVKIDNAIMNARSARRRLPRDMKVWQR